MNIQHLNPFKVPFELKTVLQAFDAQQTQAGEVEHTNHTGHTHDMTHSGGSSEPFMERVLLALSELGLDPAKMAGEDHVVVAQAQAALLAFADELHHVLNAAIPLSDPAGIVYADESSLQAARLSGGTNFKYSVDLTKANLGEYLEDVKANLREAFDSIGLYVSSPATFHLKVLTKNTDPRILAEANSAMLASRDKQGNIVDIETQFWVDTNEGTESGEAYQDATLYLNLANLGNMSFEGDPPADKFDLATILTHEILHGIGFTGNLGTDLPAVTAYDEHVEWDWQEQPVFTGDNAVEANDGQAVPLSPSASGQLSSYYHVAVAGDLMAESLKKGEIRNLSDLDVAMLKDMGFPTTGVQPSTVAQLQEGYGVSHDRFEHFVQSLAQQDFQGSHLEDSFVNLLQTTGNSAAFASLPDFLQRFAAFAGTDSTSGSQGNLGVLFSATA